MHAGAGAYICGEETALLEGLEGRRGQPRLRPPFPAVAGLYASPTVINNVESIASVPEHRRPRCGLVRLDGHREVQGLRHLLPLRPRAAARASTRPPLGITLRELLDLAGGMREGHELKFWTPGGSSTPMLTAEHLDVPLDFEEVGEAGSMLGTRAPAALRRDHLRGPGGAALDRVLQARVLRQVHAVPRGHLVAGADAWPAWSAARAARSDLDLLLDQCDNILGRSFCALGDGATSPISSSIEYFREEYLAHLTQGGCPVRPGGLDRLRPLEPRHEHRRQR